jgi:hypothetical protein
MAVLLRETHAPVTRSEVQWALGQGVIGGIVAGIVFAMFEMIASAMMMGWEAFFMPLRMIGAMVLGEQALEPTYSLWAAGAAGVMVHMVLAVIYGAVFTLILGGLRSMLLEIVLGGLYGFALWVINFYLVAPALFPWFLEANPVVQFIGHTVFFGMMLGLYVWWARSRAPTTPA